jgi:hypothetical protein
MPAILVIPPKSARPVQEAEGLQADYLARFHGPTVLPFDSSGDVPIGDEEIPF